MNTQTNGVHVNEDDFNCFDDAQRKARIKRFLVVGSRTVAEIAAKVGLSHLPHVVRATLREMKEAGEVDCWAHGRQAQRWELPGETAVPVLKLVPKAPTVSSDPTPDQFAQLRSYAFGIAEEAESIINHASRLGNDAEAMAFVRIAVDIRRLVSNIEAVCP